MTLRDVNGTFQINEPLIINGIDSGNNVTEIVDNDIESIKAVHSTTGSIGGVGSGNTTFAANTVLDRKKQIFNDGTEITISGSGNTRTLDSAQVADFRSQLKVGDIITYDKGSNETVPAFNRVTAVTQNNATITIVAAVSGVCVGGVTNGTRSGVSVAIPTLNESNNPGLRVKLANDNIASVNVLDSSYITRKQFTASVSGSSAVFNISSLGAVSYTHLTLPTICSV